MMNTTSRCVLRGFIFFLLGNIFCWAGDAPRDYVKDWVYGQLTQRSIRSALLEYNVELGAERVVRHVLAFSEDRFYHQHQVTQGATAPYESIPAYSWFDGGSLVELTGLSDIMISPVSENFLLGIEAVRGGAFSPLTHWCFTPNTYPWANFADAERIDGKEALRYRVEYSSELAYICSFEEGADPFPISVLAMLNGELIESIAYNEWFWVDGYYFPREITKCYYRDENGIRQDSPVFTMKVSLRYISDVNEHISAIWFIPRLGSFDKVAESIPRSSDTYNIRFDSWFELMTKYPDYLSPL